MQNLKQTISRFVKSKQKILILPFDGTREDVSSHWHHLLKIRVFRAFWKSVVHLLTQSMPSSWLKNALLRSCGVRIGSHVFIGQGASLDPQFPELITIEEGAIIGIDCHIMTHEITHTHVRLGKIKIGKNALIGAMSIIRSGVTIGLNSAIGMGSLVIHDVKPNTLLLGTVDPIEKKMESPV